MSIIYTDLKKAFDTVPHDLLLAKLEHYGVRNETLKWIASFLDNRKQRVVVDGVASDYCPVESGVPQGGTLSGLFFIIYMNDLPPHLKSTSVSMYADDAKIFAPVTEEQSISNIQQDINVLSDWCIEWRLQLNPRKCFFIHFTPRNTNKIFVPIYQINGLNIERRTKAKDLGIIVSDTLSFSDHIDQSCKDAKSEIGRIRRSFISRSPQFLAGVYKTYVRPNIEYCVQVWNPVYKGDITKLEKVQNKLTKLLPHGKVMTPLERNEMMGLTTHETRRLRGDLIQLYKYSRTETSPLKPKSNDRTRGNSRALTKEHCRTNIRAHSFFLRNINVWNQLPEDIVTAETVNVFKTKIDKYLNASNI